MAVHVVIQKLDGLGTTLAVFFTLSAYGKGMYNSLRKLMDVLFCTYTTLYRSHGHVQALPVTID